LSGNIDDFVEKWENTMNSTFIKIVEKHMKGESGSFGIDKASNLDFDTILEEVWEEFSERVEKDSQEEYRDLVKNVYQEFRGLILENTNSLLGITNSGETSLKELLTRNQERRLTKSKKAKKKRISGEVESFLASLVLKGMPAEIATGFGKVRTGTVKTGYSSISGKKSTGAIQTDVIEIYSLNGEIESDLMSSTSKALELAKGREYERLQSLLNFVKKDHFVVHNSIKDYIPEAPTIGIRA
jgi:hypothetical protein